MSLGQTVNAVVQQNHIQVNVTADSVDEVVTTDCQAITVTGNLPDSQIGISYFGSCCNSSCTSVYSVEAIRIYIVR